MAPMKLCLNRDFHAALYPGAICSIPHCSANATAKPAVLPHWSHGDGRLPDGRLTRPLPQPAEGHGDEAWCQHWNGTAGGRWGPRLPGQPPSSLVPHALVRMALAIIQRPIGALWARHADTHPQADTLRSRVYTMRRYGVRPTFSQLVSLRRESVFARLLAGVTLVTPTC